MHTYKNKYNVLFNDLVLVGGKLADCRHAEQQLMSADQMCTRPIVSGVDEL